MGVVAVSDLAAAAAPMVNVGWTPTTTMGLLTNIIAVALGGGALKVFANHLLAMRKIADARANAVDARGDAQADKLSARVSDLETQAAEREKFWADERREFDKALSDERRDCDKQLSEMRAENRVRDERHEAAIREMQNKVDGLVRQLIAFQTSEARALPLSGPMTRAMDTLEQVQAKKDAAE